MVRLKVFFVRRFSAIHTISIPYGSIKSCTGGFWIPMNDSSFQFLMVRLKVCEFLFFQLLGNLFQFLMVRLKGCGRSSRSSKRNSFQFLMVRLKGYRKPDVQHPLPISIPYGSIKRCSVKSTVTTTHSFQFLMVRLKGARRNGTS